MDNTRKRTITTTLDALRVLYARLSSAFNNSATLDGLLDLNLQECELNLALLEATETQVNESHAKMLLDLNNLRMAVQKVQRRLKKDEHQRAQEEEEEDEESEEDDKPKPKLPELPPQPSDSEPSSRAATPAPTPPSTPKFKIPKVKKQSTAANIRATQTAAKVVKTKAAAKEYTATESDASTGSSSRAIKRRNSKGSGRSTPSNKKSSKQARPTPVSPSKSHDSAMDETPARERTPSPNTLFADTARPAMSAADITALAAAKTPYAVKPKPKRNDGGRGKSRTTHMSPSQLSNVVANVQPAIILHRCDAQTATTTATITTAVATSTEAEPNTALATSASTKTTTVHGDAISSTSTSQGCKGAAAGECCPRVPFKFPSPPNYIPISSSSSEIPPLMEFPCFPSYSTPSPIPSDPVQDFIGAFSAGGSGSPRQSSPAPYPGFGRGSGLVNDPMGRCGTGVDAPRPARGRAAMYRSVASPAEFRYHLPEPTLDEIRDAPPPHRFEGIEYGQFDGDDLSLHGGVPPLYSEVADCHELEWPICFKARVSGKNGQWAYVDRHAAISVIGKSALPPDAQVHRCALRRSIDLPWKGRGDAYFYDSWAEISFFIEGALCMKHKFYVVTSLGEAIVLGHEFAVAHGVWVEDRVSRPLRCWVRGRPVLCERARRAWQVPDTRGGYRPRSPPPFMRR